MKEEQIMGILWTIVLGFVIGVMAKLLHPGKENMGCLLYTSPSPRD